MGAKEIEIERTGVDLLVALDVSRFDAGRGCREHQPVGRRVKAIERLLDRLVATGSGSCSSPGSHLARPSRAITRRWPAAGRRQPWMVSEQGSDLGKAIARGGRGELRSFC